MVLVGLVVVGTEALCHRLVVNPRGSLYGARFDHSARSRRTRRTPRSHAPQITLSHVAGPDTRASRTKCVRARERREREPDEDRGCGALCLLSVSLVLACFLLWGAVSLISGLARVEDSPEAAALRLWRSSASRATQRRHRVHPFFVKGQKHEDHSAELHPTVFAKTRVILVLGTLGTQTTPRDQYQHTCVWYRVHFRCWRLRVSDSNKIKAPGPGLPCPPPPRRCYPYLPLRVEPWPHDSPGTFYCDSQPAMIWLLRASTSCQSDRSVYDELNAQCVPRRPSSPPIGRERRDTQRTIQGTNPHHQPTTTTNPTRFISSVSRWIDRYLAL